MAGALAETMTNATQQTASLAVRNSLSARACIRGAAGAGPRVPVVVVPGDGAPAVLGEGSYHTTPSGLTRVRHPNAYGWRTVYHPSTIRVEVGAEWVRRHCPTSYAEASL